MMSGSRVLEKAKGFDVPDSGKQAYLGSRDNVLFRYKYNYKNQLQWGILRAKDAGESYFDFYSFHLFAKGPGCIKTLALGDFTVNMGQGLMQWQTLAFKKSADVLCHQTPVACTGPSQLTGRIQFSPWYRTYPAKKINGKPLLSLHAKRIDGTPVADSVNNDDYISSFRTSGYHRTAAEKSCQRDRAPVGHRGRYQLSSRQCIRGPACNELSFFHCRSTGRMSPTIFAFNGTSLANAGMDYSYTFRNLHVFGEAATDNHFHKAFVQGALLSPDAKLDISLLWRQIDENYQSLYSNAFTESTTPVNENGLYMGLSFRPLYGVQLNGYSDVFRFPWLKYRIDAPAAGHDYLLQLTVTPNKTSEFYLRYKTEITPINQADSNPVMTMVGSVPKQDVRLQCTMAAGRRWTIRHRTELVWYDTNGPDAGQGFLVLGDGIYRSASGAWQGSLRFYSILKRRDTMRVSMPWKRMYPLHINTPSFYNKGLPLLFQYTLGSYPNRRV